MQAVRVKGVSNPMQFPDDMDIDDIREFLRRRFTQQAVEGNQPRDLDPLQATAQAYQPTMQEKFSQGVGSALTSSGLVSDNYQAQNIGKNIGNIAAFSPAGAAFGGDEFGTAAKKGDKLGMALGALEGVGIGGDIAKLAIFGGVLAKSADLNALAKAKKLETGGANRDEIWKETGWANDNGDWKFEIDDRAADFDASDAKTWSNPDNTYSYQYGDTENIVKHPDLFNNYPEEGKINLRLDRMSAKGQFDPDNGITINKGMLDNNDKKSTSLHELQHAIQRREGFAGGGSPEEFAPRKAYIKQTHQKIDAIKKENPALARAYNNYKYKEEALNAKYGSDTDKWPNDVAEKYFSDSDELLKIDGAEELLTLSDNIYNPPSSELEQMPSAVDQYQRLAGEAEARNVQTRMDWTPGQRRETPPWASLDVPEDELIYRKGGGINQSSVLGGGVKLTKSPFDLGGEVNDRLAVDGAHIDVVESKWSPTKFSIVEFLTDENARGQGKGGQLLDEAIARYGEELTGSFSSKESVKMAYNRGFRPLSDSGIGLDDALKKQKEDSSITMSFIPLPDR